MLQVVTLHEQDVVRPSNPIVRNLDLTAVLPAKFAVENVIGDVIRARIVAAVMWMAAVASHGGNGAASGSVALAFVAVVSITMIVKMMTMTLMQNLNSINTKCD